MLFAMSFTRRPWCCAVLNRDALFLLVTMSAWAIQTAMTSTIRVDSAEYCQWETFNASCSDVSARHVIVMLAARYGRMRFGRCMREDHGSVGCAADVLSILDRKCSGRATCQLTIPDASLHNIHPCPRELMPYLEASYSCVPAMHYRTLQTPPQLLSLLRVGLLVCTAPSSILPDLTPSNGSCLKHHLRDQRFDDDVCPVCSKEKEWDGETCDWMHNTAFTKRSDLDIGASALAEVFSNSNVQSSVRGETGNDVRHGVREDASALSWSEEWDSVEFVVFVSPSYITRSSVSCPWVISVSRGKRINITIIPASTDQLTSRDNREGSDWQIDQEPVEESQKDLTMNRLSSEILAMEGGVITKQCDVRLIIVDEGRRPESDEIEVSLCDGTVGEEVGRLQRRKHLYSSIGSRLTLYVGHKVGVDNRGDLGRDNEVFRSGTGFILLYEVYGCEDITSLANAFVRREGDTTIVRCNYTADTYFLACRDSQWKGEIQNCTEGPVGMRRFTAAVYTYGILAVIGIGVAFGVTFGVLILFIVVIHLRRRKKLQGRTEAVNDALLSRHDKLDNVVNQTIYTQRRHDDVIPCNSLGSVNDSTSAIRDSFSSVSHSPQHYHIAYPLAARRSPLLIPPPPGPPGSPVCRTRWIAAPAGTTTDGADCLPQSARLLYPTRCSNPRCATLHYSCDKSLRLPSTQFRTRQNAMASPAVSKLMTSSYPPPTAYTADESAMFLELEGHAQRYHVSRSPREREEIQMKRRSEPPLNNGAATCGAFSDQWVQDEERAEINESNVGQEGSTAKETAQDVRAVCHGRCSLDLLRDFPSSNR